MLRWNLLNIGKRILGQKNFGIDNPLFKDGFVDVPNKPGLGIDCFNEELIVQHMHEKYPEIWAPTTEWDKEWANDRGWS